ncbi:hypothetical protein U9M48_043469 [Paspalum notatum var. saurae]|uniref:Uncharacterized protein n=1 Tax=Paspalum notatum var. saurae TaxID=547442 RepID=A0AAQ3UZA9_PASNO
MSEETVKVQNRPRNVSAMYAPAMGVIQTAPVQLLTLRTDGTVASWSCVVRYTTRFDATP